MLVKSNVIIKKIIELIIIFLFLKKLECFFLYEINLILLRFIWFFIKIILIKNIFSVKSLKLFKRAVIVIKFCLNIF